MQENEAAFLDDGDIQEQYKIHHQLWQLNFLQYVFNQKNIFLEEILNRMIIEYEYMDRPITTPSKPNRPPSETPTIDKILLTPFY
jgi:hypothetical protein